MDSFLSSLLGSALAVGATCVGVWLLFFREQIKGKEAAIQEKDATIESLKTEISRCKSLAAPTLAADLEKTIRALEAYAAQNRDLTAKAETYKSEIEAFTDRERNAHIKGIADGLNEALYGISSGIATMLAVYVMTTSTQEDVTAAFTANITAISSTLMEEAAAASKGQLPSLVYLRAWQDLYGTRIKARANGGD